MQSPLEQAGAVRDPSRFAPLHVNRIFTGLWTQRNPLREAAVPHVYEKFYAAARFDSLLDGANVEITSKLTLAPRPGHSVYNSQHFPKIKRFSPFKVFNGMQSQIHVMAAGADGNLYDATGPSTKITVVAGARADSDNVTQPVGNVLYIGTQDPGGIAPGALKWFQTLNSWAAATSFAQGYYIVDGNNFLWWVITGGISAGVRPNFEGTDAIGNTLTDGTVTWLCKDLATEFWGIPAPAAAPTVSMANYPPPFPASARSTFYSPSGYLLDSNTAIQQLITSGTTGGVQPAWSAVLNAVTNDGSAQWKNLTGGANSANPLTNHAYALGAVIAVQFSKQITHNFRDPETHEIESITITVNYYDFFKAIVAGTSGNVAPNWLSGLKGSVKDGSVTWQNAGVLVNWTGAAVSGYTPIAVGATKAVKIDQIILDDNGNQQQVHTPGTTAAGIPTWSTIKGQLTTDGGMTWIENGPAPGSANSGQWFYGYSFRNTLSGHESSVSPLSVPVTLAKNSYINLSGQILPANNDTQGDTIRIYRTAQNGSTLLFLADIPWQTNGGVNTSGTWQYQDSAPDSDLNPAIQAAINGHNNPPPNGLIALSYHLGRIWGAVGNTLYYSAPQGEAIGVGPESFPPANTFIFPNTIVRTWPTAIGLIVFTSSDVYIIKGQGTAISPFYPLSFALGYGLFDYDAFDVSGSLAYIMSTSCKLLSFDPGAGIIEVGFPIGDLLYNKFFFGGTGFVKAGIAWYEGASFDTGLFVTDISSGNGGWNRMGIAAAPEQGLIWSPTGQLAPLSASSAMNAIETLQGVKQLLVGPGNAGGPILFRDTNSGQDNAVAFPPYAVIGSIVLAQPGNVAEVEFIEVDTLSSVPPITVSVLLDEIADTNSNTRHWQTLQPSVPDPPDVAASVSVTSRRYYLQESQEPILCRHMQLRLGVNVPISGPVTAGFPEVLSYTIFGGLVADR